jgi:hypothetical protein
MKILQTYYRMSKGKDAIFETSGFLTPDMNWMSMALSCVLLKKHYGHVTLYCNKGAEKLIIEDLALPYDEVICMPDILDNYDGCNLWALPKVYTYSQQTEPFMHVDCDWYMFDKLNKKIIEADIFGQNIEYDDQFYNRRMLEKLIAENADIPSFVMDEYNEAPVLRTINAGIIGGNDIKFFDRYIKQIEKFILTNKPILSKLKDGFINSIYEQMFYYLLAKKENKTIGLCTIGDQLSTRFDWFPFDFTYSPKHGYMHLLAGLKRRFDAYVFVSLYLARIAPDIHEHIIQTCSKKGIFPLINFPNIANSHMTPWQERLCPKTIKNSPIIFSLSGMIPSKKDADLLKDEKRLYIKQMKNWDILWNTSNLCQSSYAVSINKNGIFSYIEKDEISKFFNSENKLKSSNKALLAKIPDAMLMRINTMIIAGVKLDIFEFVKNKKNVMIKEIAQYLISKYTKEMYLEDEVFIWVDKLMRSLIKCNILIVL